MEKDDENPLSISYPYLGKKCYFIQKKKTKEICLFMTKPIVYNPVLIFYKNNYANPKIKVSIVWCFHGG